MSAFDDVAAAMRKACEGFIGRPNDDAVRDRLAGAVALQLESLAPGRYEVRVDYDLADPSTAKVDITLIRPELTTLAIRMVLDRIDRCAESMACRGRWEDPRGTVQPWPF